MTAPTLQGQTEPAFQGLFDYAGMFPPANKSLAAAVKESAHFPDHLKRPGLVGADLVLTRKDWRMLDETKLAKSEFGQRPCKLAIVGVAVGEGLATANAIAAHNARPGDLTPIVSMEVHVEDALPLDDAAAIVQAARGVPVFVEFKWPLPRITREIAAQAALLKRVGAGLKVRCAGATALDRPTLAAAVQAAADTGIPFKATQGLHHPVPRPGFEHGFFGLVAAVRLRQHFGSQFTDIAACLAETDAGAFDFKQGVAWRNFRVPAEALPRLPPFAIGSCSLVEPDDDLAALETP